MIKSNFNGFIKLILFVIVLLVGVEVAGDEKEKQQPDIETRDTVLNEIKNTQAEKEEDKKAKTFKPTEEVSADQAVAFPTDI